MGVQCKNCGNTAKNSYCDICGQPTNTKRIDFSYILSHLTSIFNLDKGFLFTIKRLFTKPGASIREYLEGKRVKYSKPFGLVFILATIYVVLTYWLNLQMESTQLISYAEANEFGNEARNIMQDYIKSIYAYFPYIQLLSIPLYAFSTYLFFRKDGYNYAEHCIINAYYICGSTIISIVLLPIVFFYGSVGEQSWSSIITVVYASFVYISLFKRSSTFIRLIKTIGAIVVSFLFILLATIVITIAIIMTPMLINQADNLFTKEEKELINGADMHTPFRVLLTTNETDSLFLRKKCTDINLKQDEESIQKLIQRLKVTLETEQGVGIAAPQVGIARNIFLFVRTDKPDYPVEVAINPRITSHPDETICFERDGCLSIPEISGNSIRYPWIEVEYTNEHGQLVKERLEGYSRLDSFVAVIFQHEYDHLQGVLFTDKLCD